MVCLERFLVSKKSETDWDEKMKVNEIVRHSNMKISTARFKET